MGQPSLGDLLAALEELAPPALAEEWDRVGLMVGRRGAPVAAAMVALEATRESLAAAAGAGCQALVVHHPLIFRPLTALDLDEPVAALAAEALRLGVHVLAAHTNLDAAPGGVGDALAEALGLTEAEPLLPRAGWPGAGLGRVGRLARNMTLAETAELVKAKLGGATVAMVGPASTQVRRVAVAGGSGNDLLRPARLAGADALVTGEVSYHTAREAEQLGMALILAGHWATEAVALPSLARRLEDKLISGGQGIKITVYQGQREPTVMV